MAWTLSRVVSLVLAFGGTPTFAFMAVLSAVPGGAGHGMEMHGGDFFSGMTLMYVLMSVFHAAPWFALAGKRRRRVQRAWPG